MVDPRDRKDTLITFSTTADMAELIDRLAGDRGKSALLRTIIEEYCKAHNITPEPSTDPSAQ